jgi:hypothetical protein
MSTPAIRALPPRPDLEYERKQAKQLLRAAKRGDAEALTRVRAQDRSLASKSAEDLKLADAQLAVAREYGFRSWPLLVRYYETFDRHRRSRIHPNRRTGREFYENQPATLLAEHRDKRQWTGAMLGSFVPRLYGLSIDHVFASEVTVDEARLVVARMFGCGSWNELMEVADAEVVDRWRDADPEHRKTLVRKESLEERLLGHIGMRMQPARVEELLAQGADPAWAAPNGYTVLEHAVLRYWNGDAVDVLAKRVTPRDTAFVAAGLGDVTRLRRFFDRSGKLTAKARRQRPDLMALGAHVQQCMPEPSDEWLLWELAIPAAFNGRAATFDLLLERGFPIDFNPSGTLLALAVGNGLLPVVELLVSRGASPDVRGWRPSQTPREMCVGYLGRRMSDPDCRRIVELLGWDPDDVARELDARRGHPQIIPDLARVLAAAREDASRHKAAEVGMEHLFIGMLSRSGMVLGYLSDAGVDLSVLKSQIADRLVGDQAAPPPDVPLAADVRLALEKATEHAHKARDGVMTPVVLFHALDAAEGPMSAIIRSFGGDVAKIRDRIAEQFKVA